MFRTLILTFNNLIYNFLPFPSIAQAIIKGESLSLYINILVKPIDSVYVL